MPKSVQPKLGEIQRQMLDTIRRPMRPGQRMQASGGETAERLIRPNSKLTSFDRLEIYNQQYWWRLVSIFAEDFPGVRAVVGERAFDRLTVEYLEACPSRNWNLRYLGDRLPEFLEQHPEITAPHSDLALEVAKVEWALTAAFDDPEETRIDPQQLASSNPSTLRLGLQPYVQLLELRYPVDRLLSKLKKRTEATESVSNAVEARKSRRAPRITAKPAREAVFLAVHRLDFLVYYRRLDAIAFRLLRALRGGETLETACELALTDIDCSPDEAAAKVREWFGLFTSLGWLTKRRGRK